MTSVTQRNPRTLFSAIAGRSDDDTALPPPVSSASPPPGDASPRALGQKNFGRTSRRWWVVKTSFALMAPARVVVNFLESVTMRNALGLMLASVVSAVVIAAVWFWTSSPRADAASSPNRQCPEGRAASRRRRQAKPRRARTSRSPRRFPRRFPPSLPRPCSKDHLRQSGCARRQPRRRRRHHGRTGLRLPAIQAARLSHRQGSGADLRRRSVADHPLGAEVAGRGMHQGNVLPGRQALHLSSGNSQAGRRRRPHRRLPHLVACASRQQEADRAAGQGRDRKGFQRDQDGARRSARAVLPLSGTAAYAGFGGLSRHAQHRDVLLRRRLLRLQGQGRRRRSSTP